MMTYSNKYDESCSITNLTKPKNEHIRTTDIINESIQTSNRLIPYFPAYLIHYFYNSKTRCDRQKQIALLKLTYKSSYVD